MELRDMSSKKPHQIPQYFHQKYSHLESHAWFDKIEILHEAMEEGTRNDELADDCYNRLIASCKYAGKRLTKFPLAPHSQHW